MSLGPLRLVVMAVVSEGEFHPVKGEDHIFSAISEQSDYLQIIMRVC